ncbi:alanine dehydrogenase [Timonella sp. A28]|uniref:alanine dehydrogenase n=1 Tax=Timonella sp. A28 TaxID=3442640 RepID=UPI003EB86848
MRIGVPKEIKNHEDRVGLTPAGVYELVHAGHTVLIETGAGLGSGFSDEEYRAKGARIASDAATTWGEAELVVKVKEPLEAEFPYLRSDLILFTYLHLAAAPQLTHALLSAGTTALAYETVQLSDGSLPLLAPMSEVAGRLSVQVGAYHLMKPAGGLGKLMGGVPGTPSAKVVVIGGGVAGTEAAFTASGMGADVTVIDRSVPRLRYISTRSESRIHTVYSSQVEIAEQVTQADLVIGSVLITGDAAPKLVTDEMIKNMQPGSVLVDIAIDQGGCFEHSRPTTHDDPVYAVHDSLFYCVSNMPGAVPHTATRALTNVTLPYISMIASHGWKEAVSQDASLRKGVNVHDGHVAHHGVAQALHLPHHELHF